MRVCVLLCMRGLCGVVLFNVFVRARVYVCVRACVLGCFRVLNDVLWNAAWNWLVVFGVVRNRVRLCVSCGYACSCAWLC